MLGTYVPESLVMAAKSEAKRRGISVAELIRAGLERMLDPGGEVRGRTADDCPLVRPSFNADSSAPPNHSQDP